MTQDGNNNKPLHQRYSELDNEVFSAFCDTFKTVDWIADFKDNEDQYCGIDLQLTAKTSVAEKTYDIELKSVHLNKMLPFCYFQRDKWFRLLQWDNDIKLYVAIYTNHNKIAIWNVNYNLLRKSEMDYAKMKLNTCKGDNLKEKLVYKLKLRDAKVFDFNLSQYKDEYSALYKQITKKR